MDRYALRVRALRVRFFFFQAEDGIRDLTVTGVQTCALPILLDEPFGAVDAKIRQELREWLVTLHHELNVTTIFVTHDQEEAMEVSNRIVIFSRGNLEQIGTPREVYEEPVNEFVARFIGVINVLELEVFNGKATLHELEFPAHGVADGQKLR